MAIAGADRSVERRSAWIWGGIVVAFLTLQVLLGGLAAFLATNDRSWAVVPDYHQGAMAWDSQRATQAASDKLGWKATLSIDPVADMLGRRNIRVTLTDSAGLPVEVHQINALVFHHARASQTHAVTLVQGATPESYEGIAPLRHHGIWEVRLSADRGANHWQTALQQELMERP
ncbi:FixH family protein [bacterium]|nr:FixH family protein [bacterium]